MRKDCILIATIPSLSSKSKVESVFRCPYVSEVRFNTGGINPYTPFQTISLLKELATLYHKKLWIDIKGRQLRVASWANPLFSCIQLNHKVNVEKGAKICFRNGDTLNITHIQNGNRIFVDPLPKEALGRGQSVNILSPTLSIAGNYLTSQDKAYLKAANKNGITHIMASFVEKESDIHEIKSMFPFETLVTVVAKIESRRGLAFLANDWLKYQENVFLMAARDDLYIELAQNPKETMDALKSIICLDKRAICASRIFPSLEKRREFPDFTDFADLELMYQIGYRRFMLCDNICNYAFDRAIHAWKEFINE